MPDNDTRNWEPRYEMKKYPTLNLKLCYTPGTQRVASVKYVLINYYLHDHSWRKETRNAQMFSINIWTNDNQPLLNKVTGSARIRMRYEHGYWNLSVRGGVYGRNRAPTRSETLPDALARCVGKLLTKDWWYKNLIIFFFAEKFYFEKIFSGKFPKTKKSFNEIFEFH